MYVRLRVGFLFWTVCYVTCDGKEKVEEVPMCCEAEELYNLQGQ